MDEITLPEHWHLLTQLFGDDEQWVRDDAFADYQRTVEHARTVATKVVNKLPHDQLLATRGFQIFVYPCQLAICQRGFGWARVTHVER